jgi:hypothetical protein
MDRRSFLKAAAAAPAIVALPAVAEPIGFVSGLPSAAVLNEAWTAALSQVTEVAEFGRVHRCDEPIPYSERMAFQDLWERDANAHAAKNGLEVVRKEFHYLPPHYKSEDPYGCGGFLSMKYALGHVS